MNLAIGQSSWLAAIAFSLSTLAASANAGVIVVDSSGGGQFTNLQMAVNSASNGDTLLVRVGGYSSFTVDGKALSIVADAGATVTVFGSVVVQNLAADQGVVLAGLKVTGATTTAMSDTPGVALYATANDGPLRLHGCQLTGAIGYGDHYFNNGGDCCAPVNHGSGWAGAILTQNQAGVAFVGCTIVGGRAANASLSCEACGNGALGGDGMFLVATRVALYDCAIIGGRGGDAGGQAGSGGAGCNAQTLTTACGLFASGTSFTGGVGGDGNDIIQAYGGVGGDGLMVFYPALAQLLDCTTAGGHGGHNCGLSQPYAANGFATSGNSTPFVFTGTRLTFSAPSPMHELTATPVTFTGQPGEHVYLRMADATGFRPIASSKGVILTHSVGASFAPPHSGAMHQTAYAADLGVIPASGVLNTTLQFPDVASARSYHLQAFSIDSTGHSKLGSFASIVVLDSAY
jgi:hypothetical protein